eukprot:11178139-Lingulodinium_polyedra.AAC.1
MAKSKASVWQPASANVGEGSSASSNRSAQRAEPPLLAGRRRRTAKEHAITRTGVAAARPRRA